MPIESEKSQLIRTLINQEHPDRSWYRNVWRLTRFSPKHLNNQEFLLANWNKEWGKLSLGYYGEKSGLLWQRPDGGPEMLDLAEQSLCKILVRRLLQAYLISDLHASGLVSFCQMGTPTNWKTCKCFLNGKELSHVIWACAVIGRCEVAAIGKDGKILLGKNEIQTITASGHIVIKPEAQDSFF